MFGSRSGSHGGPSVLKTSIQSSGQFEFDLDFVVVSPILIFHGSMLHVVVDCVSVG